MSKVKIRKKEYADDKESELIDIIFKNKKEIEIELNGKIIKVKRKLKKFLKTK